MRELDEDGPVLADRALWSEVDDLAGIGELTARWLEGDITYRPARDGRAPGEETAEPVPVLAALNRAGFVTDFSQTGLQLTAGSARRAAVGGFCDERMRRNLAGATAATDLVVLWFAPAVKSVAQAVVTLDGGKEVTWLGTAMAPDAIEYSYGEDVSLAGLEALIDAWQVHLFDPVWGRDDLLWPLLADVAAQSS
ncbi:DUF6919 domain-containing protein [Amycolatopsis sp.]|uniref:DUF6919 domain-containing protein n=1 Tax=Amycolatopsis sp. TaxID=37632 RepID=UPI002DF8AD59|nr:hypothetical protein [Amycolatopsis sp.]